MATAINFPVTVTPEADAYIEQVGKRKTFELLLEEIPVHYPHVLSVSASMDEDYGTGLEPCVMIQVMREDPGHPDGANGRWTRWLVENVPTEDYIHFCVYSLRV